MNSEILRTYILLQQRNVDTQAQYHAMYSDPDHTTAHDLTAIRVTLREQVAQLKRLGNNPEITFFLKGKI